MEQKFKAYKLRSQSIKIYHDSGYCETASMKVTKNNIIDEIRERFDVIEIVLTGSILRGLRASTWPLICNRCFNCGCEPVRRYYGGVFEDQRYCAACFREIERKGAAKNFCPDRRDMWKHMVQAK